MILEYQNINNEFYNIKEVANTYFHMSSKLIVKLKNKQKILLNGNIAKITDQLQKGDIVQFDLNYEEESENIVPTKMDLEIVFEDDALLIINKPANMPVHPSINHYEDSLSNGVKYYFNQIGLNKKIRPVNRLDKDTSGLVVFVKNEYIQENLINQMKSNLFQKEYLAILWRNFTTKSRNHHRPYRKKRRKYYRKRNKLQKRPRSHNRVQSFKRSKYPKPSTIQLKNRKNTPNQGSF